MKCSYCDLGCIFGDDESRDCEVASRAGIKLKVNAKDGFNEDIIFSRDTDGKSTKEANIEPICE